MSAQNLKHCRNRDSQHHAGNTEQRTAYEQCNNNHHGMQTDDSSHDLGHDNMTVDLLDHDIKNQHLDRQRQADRCP